MPISACEITPANFLNELFQLGLRLQENIKKLDTTRLERHKLVDLFEPDVQGRTIEDFCATQTDINLNDEVEGVNVSNGAVQQDSKETDLHDFEKLDLYNKSSSSLAQLPRSTSKVEVEVKALPCARGLKRKSASPSSVGLKERLRFPAVPNDTFLFSQMASQSMPLPQMTQEFPVFQEPENLCFFQRKPKRTFADRLIPKSGMSLPESKKRASRILDRGKSPEIF